MTTVNRLDLILDALGRAIKQSQGLSTELVQRADDSAKGPAMDAKLLLEAAIIIQGWDINLDNAFRDVWNHGWHTGYADRNSHIRKIEFSEAVRHLKIRETIDKLNKPLAK